MSLGQNASSDKSLSLNKDDFDSEKRECLLCRNELICRPAADTLCLTVFKCCFYTRSSPAYALPRMYMKRYLLIGLGLYFILECSMLYTL